LTKGEAVRLVNAWIGVSGGYLGSFGYASHDEFWLMHCDVDVSTNDFDGSTRECFIDTLLSVPPDSQANALRAILDEYPPEDRPAEPENPRFRTPAFHQEIQRWISRLEGDHGVVAVELPGSPEMVQAALDDAELLLRSPGGPQRAVDRVHTALHGYLRAMCVEAQVDVADRPSLTACFKRLRQDHPALADLALNGRETSRLGTAMAGIVDALEPIRNNRSAAHPNPELLGPAEAVLAINAASSLLAYLEVKRKTMTLNGEEEPF
jgi:hypothetical protein